MRQGVWIYGAVRSALHWAVEESMLERSTVPPRCGGAIRTNTTQPCFLPVCLIVCFTVCLFFVFLRGGGWVNY